MDPLTTWILLGLGWVIGWASHKSAELYAREKRRRAADAVFRAPINARIDTARQRKAPAGLRPTGAKAPRPSA